MNKKRLSYYWDKFWYLLWKDDSLKGWIFALVFLFVFIKLIFFPVLSLVTGTSLPMAIVESCSMYHDGNLIGNFDNWWEGHETKYEKLGIEKEEFQEFIFKKGFNKGDILFLIKANPEKLKIGDVILFSSGESPNPIIHRVINIRKENNEYIFSTIGDNNQKSFSLDQPASVNPNKIDEINIKENQLVGKAVFKLAPYVGWGKLIFFEHFRSENERGFCDEN